MITDIIEEMFPDMGLPQRMQINNEVQPYISLLKRHSYLRIMTIVEILNKLYIEPVESCVKKELINEGG